MAIDNRRGSRLTIDAQFHLGKAPCRAVLVLPADSVEGKLVQAGGGGRKLARGCVKRAMSGVALEFQVTIRCDADDGVVA